MSLPAAQSSNFNYWLRELVLIRDAVRMQFDASDAEVRKLPLRDLYDLYRLIGEEAFS